MGLRCVQCPKGLDWTPMKTITQEQLKSFQWAYAYDSASPMGWLRSELAGMHQSVRMGTPITVEDYKATVIRSPEDFKAWLTEWFPYFVDEFCGLPKA